MSMTFDFYLIHNILNNTLHCAMFCKYSKICSDETPSLHIVDYTDIDQIKDSQPNCEHFSRLELE